MMKPCKRKPSFCCFEPKVIPFYDKAAYSTVHAACTCGWEHSTQYYYIANCYRRYLISHLDFDMEYATKHGKETYPGLMAKDWVP